MCSCLHQSIMGTGQGGSALNYQHFLGQGWLSMNGTKTLLLCQNIILVSKEKRAV